MPDRTARPDRTHPRSLAFVGPALGGHQGWVTTQGEVLAGLFAAEGDDVLVSSRQLSPVRRAADHARDLVRWRRRADVAVVSVFSGRAFALAHESLALAGSLGIPTVAWLHGGGLPDFAHDRPRWTRRVLRSADAVVAPSAYLARWARSLGVTAEIVPNVLDLDVHPLGHRTAWRPRLLWMRTFQDLYDPEAAVRVLGELRARGIDATLTMAGQDKGRLGTTIALAERIGVDRWTTFPGFAAGPAKTDLLVDHDVFLNTNRVDNSPVTVLEAAASGLVVVSTDAGGLPDLLPDGEAAVLVPAGDPAAMAEAVADLLTDPERASRLAAGARAVAERSAWPAVRTAWLDVVDRISR